MEDYNRYLKGLEERQEYGTSAVDDRRKRAIEITRHNIRGLAPKIGFRPVDDVAMSDNYAIDLLFYITIGFGYYVIHRDEAKALHHAGWLPQNIYQALVTGGFRG